MCNFEVKHTLDQQRIVTPCWVELLSDEISVHPCLKTSSQPKFLYDVNWSIITIILDMFNNVGAVLDLIDDSGFCDICLHFYFVL